MDLRTQAGRDDHELKQFANIKFNVQSIEHVFKTRSYFKDLIHLKPVAFWDYITLECIHESSQYDLLQLILDYNELTALNPLIFEKFKRSLSL